MNAIDPFNLFLLLDLDPNDEWDQERFEQRLKEKKRQWDKDAQGTRIEQAYTARANRKKIPVLKEIAGDKVKRDRHADEAKQPRSKAEEERKKAFSTDLELLELKGHLLNAEFLDLVNQYGDVFSESDIRAQLHVRVIDATEPTTSPRNLLDKSKAREIEELLSSLQTVSGKQMKNLYEFLGEGLTKDTDLKTLIDNAVKLHELGIGSGIKDDLHTLIGALAGHCLEIFKTQSQKDQYDATCEDATYNELRKRLDKAGAYKNIILSVQIEKLLNDFSNLNKERTTAVIRDYVRSKHYEVELGTFDAIRRLRRCGYDGTLCSIDEKRCTTCGEPLTEPCPRCGESLPTEQGACSKCGFPAGNRVYVKVLCGEADEACRNRDYVRAEELLQDATRAWPAGVKGTLAERIQSLNAKIKPALAGQTSALEQLRQAVRERHFYKAQELFTQAESLCPESSNELAALQRDIEKGKRDALIKVESARRYTGPDPDGRVEIYQMALDICSDCREALDGLAQTPPAGGRGIEAKMGGNIVHLSWQPSPSRNVSYAVVRKSWSRPVSASDGVRLATVPGTAFDDTEPEIGLPVFYAVYADRHGVSSTAGAVISEPVQIVCEVSQVTPRIDNCRVMLSWKAPPNVQNVIVQRSDRGFPKSLSEGERIPVVGNEQATDAGLENERKYFYTLFAQFKTANGSLLTTSGVNAEVVPQEPPEAIKELKLLPEGSAAERRVHISWSAPKRGSVTVFASDKPYGVRCGDVMPLDALKAYGKALPSQGISAMDHIGESAFRYYLPVVLFQDIGYLGQEQYYVCVDEADGLTVQNLGHALRLQWNWPPNCHEVVVAHCCDAWPQPGHAGTSSVPLTRAQYDLRGYLDIPNPAQADHYVAIFTVYSRAGQRLSSQGTCRKKVSVQSRIEVSYEIKKSWFRKRLSLILKIKGSGTLPSMLLIRKQSRLPENRNDGDIVYHLSAGPVVDSEKVVELPETVKGNQCYAALFLVNEDDYDFLTLQKPTKEKLRVF